jgi:hypothetical protein
MRGSRLTPLQEHLLYVLAGAKPPWTLTGGAALAGFRLGHRATRDLDLFWHGLAVLPDISGLISALEADGLSVSVLRRAPTFVELRARSGDEVVILDLVADPVPPIDPPTTEGEPPATFLVDTPHEILVNKLNALLSRSEIRDLVDVRALLEAGGDLERSLEGAAAKDGGFSPATLAWVLKELPIPALAKASGWPVSESPDLIAFRNGLVERLARLSRPPR